MENVEKKRLLFGIWANQEKSNLDLFIRRNLWIRTKAGPIIRFRPNAIQRYYAAQKAKALAEGKEPKFIVLKYRRGGITTWEQAASFHLTMSKQGQQAVTLAHDKEATEDIFAISTLFYERMDPLRRVRRRALNKRELNYPELRSKFYTGTAGTKGFGRGSTIQRVHGSEVAQWPGGILGGKKLMAGIKEATEEGEIVLESTAEGMGNWFQTEFHDAMKGISDFTPIFLAWYMDPTNRIPVLPGDEIVLSEEETLVVAKYGLDHSQIKWRRKKKVDLKELFLQEYPEDWVTAFLVTGVLFFSQNVLQELIMLCPEPLTREYIHTNLDVPKDLRDHLTIWHPPAKDGKHFIGADSGEGIPGQDPSCAGVLDLEGRQCAVLHGYWTPEAYGRLLVHLANWYNYALLAPEANNHGHSVLNTIKNECHYGHLYFHRDYDRRSNVKAKIGWQTNAKTRPILLDNLKEAVHEGFMEVNHKDFLSECFTFMDDGSGKYQARSGCHDDTVLAWGIAWQARKKGSQAVGFRELGDRSDMPKPEKKSEEGVDDKGFVALKT